MNKQANDVIYYVEQHINTPLHFSGVEIVDPPDQLEKLIYAIQLKMEEHASMDHNEFQETTSDRNRSIIDIWRHAKFYQPNVTIFQVMRAMSRLVGAGKSGCTYCGDIKRRVFRPHNAAHPEWMKDYVPNMRDEFGLFFFEWARIGIGVKHKIVEKESYGGG
jgi:hypothetical protein